MKHINIFAAIIIVTAACSQRETIVNSSAVKKIDQLSDSTFITDISAALFAGSNIFISDKNRGQIFELDEDLNLVRTYGKTGEGPGEFSGLPTFTIDGDYLFASNDGKQTIEVFAIGDSTHIKTIRVPNELIGSTLEHRFVCKNFKITSSASENGVPIASFDSTSTVLAKFGQSYEFNNAFQNKIRNYRFLFLKNDAAIISVSDNMATIELYDEKGNLLASKEIKDARPVQDRMQFVAVNDTKEENSYYRIFRDVYFDATTSRLYLLSIGGKDDPISKEVLVYNIGDDNTITYEKTIILPGEWYSAICVKGDQMIVFETTTDQLELHKL